MTSGHTGRESDMLCNAFIIIITTTTDPRQTQKSLQWKPYVPFILQAYERLAYCPQADPLLDYLTGRETLSLFARIAGIPEVRIPTSVNRLIRALELSKVADMTVMTYRWYANTISIQPKLDNSIRRWVSLSELIFNFSMWKQHFY